MAPAAAPSLGAGDSPFQRTKRKPETRPDKAEEEDEEDKDLGTATPHDELIPRSGHRISTFPSVVRHIVNRPHPAVLAIVASERSRSPLPFRLENISHGQFQALSSVLPDHPALADSDKPSAFVCSPPPLLRGKGVTKKFKDRPHLLPFHSEWFDPAAVHRIERPVVPHFFSGKSDERTPESYMRLRNEIVGKYLENPGRQLGLADCGGGSELDDLGRILRFLDHWGIVNYCAPAGRPAAELAIRETTDGELTLDMASLKRIESLMRFDRPRNSEISVSRDVYPHDLDRMIRERFSDHDCSICARPLTQIYYSSSKEVDVVLCSDCYHDGTFVAGHSSLSFAKADSSMDSWCDANGENWSDQETMLLLEGVEKFGDNWNEIAELVGTKSKAQCLLHFLRLPVEHDLLENIPVPGFSQEDDGLCPRLPFADSGNPLMSLVAFLATAVGPRVGAACAGAALSVLTKDDAAEPIRNDEASSSVPPDKVKAAAMVGLSAAAMKAKLFADQEEREIQRLAAGIVHQQLKRLETKLKQFAEVEALLTKECEQAERMRQRFMGERARLAAGPTPSPSSTFYGGTPANLSQISSLLARQQQASNPHPLL